ncbi:glycogen synthase kinase binding protein [Anarrhichthys ocellatus]|uniref:glycogen synthase kinase binding protein n=1 Tax=Anarrhichthys ocellatus TaxID=433405 RepID=UPI0012EE233D|nr:GSK-3-binding protein-like [Anarrhichthys ocellatus]
MPCRKENYIFLQQSVTVDSKEVDALVTKIGEALQLHNHSGGGHQKKTVSVSVSCLHGGTTTTTTVGGVKPAAIISGGSGGDTGRHGCCMRLRNRNHRANPYSIQEWDHQIKPWNNKKRRTAEEDDDDPHRLLQELILSGNLIKEAVKRLQFSAAADRVSTADRVPC